MKSRVTLTTVLKVIEITSRPIFSWPLPSDASRETIWRREICRWTVLVHNTIGVSFMFYDAYRNFSYDLEHSIIAAAEWTATVATIVTMVLCKKEETRFQDLLEELHLFLKQANKEESDVTRTYIDKCLSFHTVLLVFIVCCPFAFILGSIAMKSPLPIDSRYPFSMETTWVWALTYISMTVMTLQAASTILFDFLFATLLWFSGARMEMSAKKLSRAANHEDVRRCIEDHQYVLKLVERMKLPIRFMVSQAMGLAMISIVTGGLILMRRPPLLVIIKFTLFEAVSVLRLFVFSWPADNMMVQSMRIADAAFNCEWIGKSRLMIKDLMFMMHRAQTPVVIDIPGLTPALTLEFYTSVMKVTFSYLTTLYAMVG